MREHLDPADQALSDAAVKAAGYADHELRTQAWRVVGDIDPPERERVFYYSAVLLLADDPLRGNYRRERDVRHLADELRGIHERHTALCLARKAADDGMG
jgi:hypothetical protein